MITLKDLDTIPCIEITEQDVHEAENCVILDLHQRLVVHVSPKPKLSCYAKIPNDLLKENL